jgi:hypothetical protein
MAKRNNVCMALEWARLARDTLGAANGVTDDYPIMPHIMNLGLMRSEAARDTLPKRESVEGTLVDVICEAFGQLL